MSESRPEKHKVEFIESYWTGGEIGSDYQWSDNHGELIRCRDCKHGRSIKPMDGFILCKKNKDDYCHRAPDWFCADGERKEDNN